MRRWSRADALKAINRREKGILTGEPHKVPFATALPFMAPAQLSVAYS